MIAHFASGLNNGAHIAARRLHDAQRRNGLESFFYYGTGYSNDPSAIPLFQNKSFFWRNLAALAISWRNRQGTPDGYVNSPGWIRKTPIQATGNSPQLINLHSVLKWLDLPSFFDSLPAGLPVVWSLHDLIPITGGCTYPGDCDHFTRNCGDCPQQKRPHPRDATRKFFQIKEKCYSGKNLHFVGNSEWTTAQLRRSGLAKHAKSIRTIHLGLNVEQFKPVNKRVAREALGIAGDKFIIGFACSDFSEHRKGAHILVEALKSLPAKEIMLLVFGGGLWPPHATDVETISVGSINSPRLQSLYYSALDVLAMPTKVETFGLVAMEAMACETPVVAYPGGGLAEVVADGVTGLIEPKTGSVAGLVRMLHWVWKHPAERAAMGKAARQRVIENFSDALMAARYLDLYNELITSEKPGSSSNPAILMNRRAGSH
jgi:glycosyltransferase involved in cell wall biosynthesis